MMDWLFLPAMAGIYGLVYWARRSNTEVGRRIRSSDQDAYDMAVERKQAELAELRAYGREHGYE